MPSIIDGSLMRATPPSRRMSAGHPLERHDRDGAGVLGDLRLLGVTTSMMTPPRSISARPRLTRAVPVVRSSAMTPSLPTPLSALAVTAAAVGIGSAMDVSARGGAGA